MIVFYLFCLFAIIKNGKFVSAHLEMNIPDSKYLFNKELYESVLDPELCAEQMQFIQTNRTDLLIEFLDAGYRTPRGVLTGNLFDLGNYYQCLNINEEIPNSVVEGKYCLIDLPLNQTLPSLPTFPEGWPEGWPEDWPETWPEDWPPTTDNSRTLRLREKVAQRLKEYYNQTLVANAIDGANENARSGDAAALAAFTFRVAVCIPKACTTRGALNALFNTTDNSSLINFNERFCRLPEDKAWVAGDYVAISIFSIIGFFVLLSTSYDVYLNYQQQKDPKKGKPVNKLFLAFSVFTNTRRLLTYNPVPGTIECLDGIRSIAMMWVIVGHTFSTLQSIGILANPLDAFEWMTSLKSVWIMAAPITVDTFFLLAGLLLVYTTVGKLSSMKLLKNLHLFYLNRLLRMFPILAATLLLQVSIFHRLADGPYMEREMSNVHRCRVFWWSTLLYIQNYLNPDHMCLSHTWYLAIDMQLYILSPLVLVFVLSGKRKIAWSGLIFAMLAILTASTTYNFINSFPSYFFSYGRSFEMLDYFYYYYYNTLTRASPFVVGLILGYFMHLNRGKKINLTLIPVAVLWCCAATIIILSVYVPYPVTQPGWDNKVAENMINSFMRPAWAMAIGWMIFACQHGYGGPINWVLTLSVWKVLGRLSYGMYIVHYPLMYVVHSTAVAPVFFTVQSCLLRFLSDFSLAVIVAFILTVTIDAPFTIFVKHFMGGGPKRPQTLKVEEKVADDEKEPDARN